jgi:hypothetical protein
MLTEDILNPWATALCERAALEAVSLGATPLEVYDVAFEVGFGFGDRIAVAPFN